MATKAPFHPYGVVLSLPDGNVILNAGNNMTIFPNGKLITFSAQVPSNTVINNITPWQLPSLSDAMAPKGSMYYSTTANKAVFKDPSGTVHALY